MAEAELVLDDQLVAGRLTAMCTQKAFTARAFGIRLAANGHPLEADVQKSAGNVCLFASAS